MENIANQLACTLVLLKEHIIEGLKPELQSVAKEVISSFKPQLELIAKEVTSMKITIQNMEETMKKSLIPPIPRSGDVASNDLDDFYISGDALQQQSQISTTIAPESSDAMNNSRFLSQQQCLQAPYTESNVFNNAAKYSGNFCGRRTDERASQQISLPCIQPTVSEEFYIGMTPVLNSQPAKKEVLANLTITSSDPLPSSNSVTWKLPQLPIPPHQIKADVLGNQHLERGSGVSKTFNNIPTSVSTTTTSNAAVSVAPTEACGKYATFTVKPEVEAPAAVAGFESFNDSTAESFSSGSNIFGMKCHPHGENEEVVFCQRAELFRQIDKEWKERETGDIKILKNKEGTHRIFVQLDQIHKICASYKILPEMTLTIPKNETKGFIWALNDFSDAELRVEKFFIRFKLPETAVAFQEAFSQAWETAKSGKTLKIEENPLSPGKSTLRNFATSTPTNKNENTTDGSSSLSGIPKVVRSTAAGAFKFTTFSLPANFKFGNSLAANTGVSIGCSSCTTSTTTLINCTSNVTGTISSLTSVSSVTNANTSMNTISSCKDIKAALASIFNNLNKSTTAPFSIAAAVTTSVAPVMVSKENVTSNLNKSAASDGEDDYVSNAEFQPVIPLPDVVEVNTGEENEIVLFEHRAKLLRFDKKAGEWKERGLGNIKLLQDKDDVNKLRLLMRREQVHKLCCNQRVYKDTVFTYIKNSDTALSWAGQDFSDNELVVEMLTVRFKTPEVCKQFLKALNEAQDRMSAEGKETNVQSSKASSEAAAQNAEMRSKEDEKKQGFGDIFKPKAGSWTCEACYILNEADKIYCVACDSPEDNTVSPKSTVSNIAAPIGKTFNCGFPAAGAASTILAPSLPTQSTFTFQKPDATTKSAIAFSDKKPTTDFSQVSPTSIGGFSDRFKPKAGSWVCPSCYVSNTGDSVHCMACQAPKNSTIPKTEANTNVLCLSDPAQKFSFGFPAANTSKSEIITPKVDFGFNTGSIPATGVFNFTTSSTTSTSLSTIPITTMAPNPATLILESSDKVGFLDGLPLQSTEALTLSKINAGQDFASDAFALNSKVFNFTFKPKSPGKSGKDPSRFGSVADGARDEDEEESSAHFTPIIPLPEKIKVKTGEEDEEILYVHRAKLYCFTDGEWKERGIGNVKILRHKESKKLRVIMRRDQVLKICLNHNLNEDVNYKRKDHKSWLFMVNDFSEEAIELQKLSLRFKNKEIADKFMEAVVKASDGTASPVIETVGSNTSLNTSASLGLPSTALNTTEENEKLAIDLKLPLNFFESAKQDCIGCRGCDPEKFTFTDGGSNEIFINEEDTKSPLLPMELPPLVLLKQSTPSPIISTTTTTTLITTTPSASINFKKKLVNAFNANANNAKESADEATPTSAADLSQENPKTCSIIKPGNIFGGFTEMGNVGEESIFSGVVNSTPTAADKTQSISIFGGTGINLSGGSIFGSWAFPSCYVSNTGDSLHCMAVEAPKKEANTNVLCLSTPAQKFTFGFPVANTPKSEIITPKVDFGFNNASIPATGVFNSTTSSTTSTSLSAIPITTMAPNSAAFIVESSDKVGFLNGLPLQSTEALTLNVMNTGQETVSDAFSLNSKVFNFTFKPKSLGKSGKGPSRFGSVADGARDENTESKYPGEEESSTHFTPTTPLPEENKKIADKFMKTVKKASDGTASPMVETLGATTSVSTSASLGPCASNITEETEKVVNDLPMRLNCFEQPNSDCIANQGYDPEKFAYIDARNHGTDLSHDNSKNCSSGNIFGDPIKTRNMGDVTNLTSTAANKPQSTCVFVSGDTVKSAFGSAINYPKDSSVKNFSFDSVAYFPSNKITTAGGYVTSRAPDRKDFSFGQKPLIFDNSSSVLGETTADKAQPTSNIFESKTNSLSKGSIFGQIPPKFGNSSSVFANSSPMFGNSSSVFANSSSMFGNSSSVFANSSPIFGNSSSAFANSSPMFGNSSPMFGNSSSVFANSSSVFANSSSMFGNSSSVFAHSSPIFGNSSSVFANSSSMFGNSSSVFANSSSTFGNRSSAFAMFGKPSPSIFDSAIKGGNVNSSIYGSSFISFTELPSNENTTADAYVLGSGEIPTTTSTHVATSLFECSAVTTNTGSANTGPFMDLSKTATAAIDFASLAAKVPKDDKVMVAFANGNEKPGPGSFIGLTDQNAFARFAKPLTGLNDAKNNPTDDCSAAGKNFNDKNFDPHYEPVIALPEKIVITTGEEEETKLFGEPATLFRWDDTNKEWKERGVGELKILFHPIKQTYRMLMRREKVYKLVLSHAVNAYFSFSEMKKSPKSFLWATINYAECPEGVLETLAVRFKNAILADLFREHINKCIAANQNRDY